MRALQTLILLTVIGFSHGYALSNIPAYIEGYDAPQAAQGYYHPRALHILQQNDLNKPVIYPQLGMSPLYSDLVYKYVTEFAGNEEPPKVKVAELIHNEANFPEKVGEEGEMTDGKENPTQLTILPLSKPGLDEHFLPSDFILLRHAPENQFYGNLDAIKMNKQNYKLMPRTNPPIGGVLSDYVLLRNRPDYKDFMPFSVSANGVDNQVNKRQAAEQDETDDTVVINAENPHSIKMNEEDEQKDKSMMDSEDNDEEDQPAIAQSKPAAIALAGPGGVAQASPVGTALVGPGGLAVAAPSGTAVAGPAGQGVLPNTADDKTKIIQKKIKEAWNN